MPINYQIKSSGTTREHSAYTVNYAIKILESPTATEGLLKFRLSVETIYDLSNTPLNAQVNEDAPTLDHAKARAVKILAFYGHVVG